MPAPARGMRSMRPMPPIDKAGEGGAFEGAPRQSFFVFNRGHCTLTPRGGSLFFFFSPLHFPETREQRRAWRHAIVHTIVYAWNAQRVSSILGQSKEATMKPSAAFFGVYTGPSDSTGVDYFNPTFAAPQLTPKQFLIISSTSEKKIAPWHRKTRRSQHSFGGGFSLPGRQSFGNGAGGLHQKAWRSKALREAFGRRSCVLVLPGRTEDMSASFLELRFTLS